MTFQISQRGRQYWQTARTLLRAARTMTDEVVASRLKALTDDCKSASRPTHWLARGPMRRQAIGR